MQLNKRIFSISILLMIALFPLHAQKKPPQTPLKELSDPCSPNYVPYPYPKTDFEIIEDFKYGVKILFGDKAKHFSVINGDISDIKLILNLLEKDTTLRVINIIRVEDMVQTSPCLYFFVFQIEDENGKVVAVGSLEDCGLFAGFSAISEKSKFRPYKTKEQVKNILTDALGQIEINKMERIGIHSSLPTSPYAPLWRISSSEGTFFVEYFNDDIYKVTEEIPWTLRDDLPDPERKRNLILDPLQGKALFVEKVKKK